MGGALLLDEMFGEPIAAALRANGHDVCAVAAARHLVSLPDDQILAHAATGGRALVTANVKDFVPLAARYSAAGKSHAGLILVSSKTFPQSRGYAVAVTEALDAILSEGDKFEADSVLFLRRPLRRAWLPSLVTG